MLVVLFIVISLVIVFKLKFKEKQRDFGDIGGEFGEHPEVIMPWEREYQQPQPQAQEQEPFTYETNLSEVESSDTGLTNSRRYEELYARITEREVAQPVVSLLEEDSAAEEETVFAFDLKEAVIYSEILKPKF